VSGEERVRDHASPLRKRVFAVETCALDDAAEVSALKVFLSDADIARPDCSSSA